VHRGSRVNSFPASGAEIVENHDAVATIDQAIDDVGTDEPRSARDDDVHRVPAPGGDPRKGRMLLPDIIQFEADRKSVDALGDEATKPQLVVDVGLPA